MTFDEKALIDDDGIEDWLESELESDDGELRVPPGVTLPSKIRWIASDGATVVVDQVLAAFSPVTGANQNIKAADAVSHETVNSTDHNNEDNRDIVSESLDSNEDTTTSDTCDDIAEHEQRITSHVENDKKRPAISETEFGDKSSALQSVSEPWTKDPLILHSTKHGTLKQAICNDTVITNADTVIGRIECSICSHAIVVHGLCVTCCQVVEEPCSKRPVNVDPGRMKRHATQRHQRVKTGRVIPGFITSDSAVRVDASVSNEMELMEILDLLRRRKLCLVLDLDNTLIHSSTVKIPDDIDIPVIDMYSKFNGYKPQFDEEEQQRRYEEAMERSILITRTRDETDGRFFINYYKLRPGVYKFLREASELYELYLFTMGTRSHAQAALKILDPEGKHFGNRIFSRSEANNSFKSLCRIFPNYTNLLLILDDSEHIWVGSPGLIKVHPYYYFTDLNVMRNRDYRTLGRVSAALQAHCNYSNYIWHSIMMDIWKEHDNNSNMSRDDDGFTIPMNVKATKAQMKRFKYNNLLMANERPSSLFHDDETSKEGLTSLDNVEPSDGTNGEKASMAKKTEEREPVPTSVAAAMGDGIGNAAPVKNSLMRKLRKIRVKDCDAQLPYVMKLLKEMYDQFYSNLDVTNVTLNDLRTLLGEKKLPDVGVLLSKHRNKILKGVVLSVNKNDFRCPLTGDELDFLGQSDLGAMSRRFGVVPALQHNQATHYLKNNISAVAPKAGVKKVHSQWLEACIYTWSHVNESIFDSDTWNEPFRTFWDVLYDPTLC